MKGIYKITSPSGKVYIGQTINTRVRFGTYKKMYRPAIGLKLFNSLLKYGFNNHEIKVIHELPCDVDQAILNEYERLYISQYKESGAVMLNLTNGGEGSIGYKHTDASRLVMKEKGKGRISGEKNPNYGKGMFGASNGMYGKKRPKELIDKIREIKSKPVVKYKFDGVMVEEFKSASEAARLHGLELSNISNVCLKRNQCKSAGGYVWRYKGDPFTIERNRNFAPVLQYSMDGEFIEEFTSVTAALGKLNKTTDGSLISSVCRGKRRIAYGFHWKYKYSDIKKTA